MGFELDGGDDAVREWLGQPLKRQILNMLDFKAGNESRRRAMNAYSKFPTLNRSAHG